MSVQAHLFVPTMQCALLSSHASAVRSEGSKFVKEDGVSNDDDARVALRREAYDLKEQVLTLARRLHGADTGAAQAVGRAHNALFEAWTILCMPPDDHEDDH